MLHERWKKFLSTSIPATTGQKSCCTFFRSIRLELVCRTPRHQTFVLGSFNWKPGLEGLAPGHCAGRSKGSFSRNQELTLWSATVGGYGLFLVNPA